MREPAVRAGPSSPSYSPADAGAAPLAATEVCPSCGAAISATFCDRCGERRPSDRIYTLREFFHEAFEVVTNVERSLLRTALTLLRKPGELTAAYMRGERIKFLRPLQVFLMVSVLYFFWAGWSRIHVFNSRFENQVSSLPYSRVAARIVEKRLPKSGLKREEYAKAFDAQSLVLARSLIVVMVPAFALALGIVSYRRRRRAPAVQHVVFSLHFFSVLLLLTMATVYVAAGMVAVRSLFTAAPAGWETQDLLSLFIVMAGVLAYLLPALGRVYGDSWTAAALKSLGLVVALACVITGFRFLLFYLTVWLL